MPNTATRIRDTVYGAVDLLQRAVLINPRSAELYVDPGRLLLLLNRAAEALVAYQQAVEDNPQQPFIHATAGEVQIMLGRLEEARQAFETAVTLALHPGIYFGLAQSRTTRDRDQHVMGLTRL